jgi:uncharacterized protein
MTFDWDSANIDHIAIHDVLPEEAEQAVAYNPLEIDYEYVDGEDRVRLLGITTQARLLCVVITFRYDKIRVVTAYPATPSQRRIYFKLAGFLNG